MVATSKIDAWASGAVDKSVIAHWNGKGWGTVALPKSTSSAIAAHGPNDVWAVSGNDVLHYNGSSWKAVSMAGAPSGRSLWGHYRRVVNECVGRRIRHQFA